MLITLTLLITLAQQPQVKPPPLPPDHRVVLAFSLTDVREMRLDNATATYAHLERKRKAKGLSEVEAKYHAALTFSLGTLPDFERLTAPGLPGSRERLDWEVRRGVRRPLQKTGRN